MPALSSGDKAQVRSRPIGRRWRFYVYQPTTVWTATVTGSPSRGDRTLSVNTVGFFDPADLLPHCTLWIRDSGGGLKQYPSKVRFKSYTDLSPAEELEVAENNIDWQAGDIIYGKRLFEIWPRFPWIDPDTLEVYKDRDIAFVDDATTQAPKANAGPAAIFELGGGGTVDIEFNDEGSFTLPNGLAPASYQWTALGGLPGVVAGAENTSTVTYRYSIPGYYYVRLVVTDTNGKTGRVYVPVIIDDGTLAITHNVPVERRWDRYGWALTRRLLGIEADESAFYDGAPCFLVADNSQVATGAFVLNRSNLRWAGWLIEDTTEREFYGRGAVYRAVSSAHILSNIPAFTGRVEHDPTPDSWYQLNLPSVDSVTYHLLRWHSTAYLVCDLAPTGEWTSRRLYGENFELDDLLSQVNHVLSACFADLRCDRQGILRMRRDPWYMSAAEQAALDEVLTLNRTDYQKVTYGPKYHHARTREVTASGTDYAGDPYLAGSPPAPLDGGRPEEVTNLGPVDEDELVQWAGQHLAVRNWSVELAMQMAGEWDVFEPARSEFVNTAGLSTFDSKLPDALCTAEDMRFRDDQERGVTLGEVTLIPEPGTFYAEAREIPEDPPIPDPEDPPDDLPWEPPVETQWHTEVWVATKLAGIYYTFDFGGPNEPMPTWIEHNTGLPNDYVWQFAMDRKNQDDRRFFALMADGVGWNEPGTEIYRTEEYGNWSLIMDNADAISITGAGTVNPKFEWVTVDEGNGRVWILWRTRDDSNSNLYLLYSDANGDPLPASWGYILLDLNVAAARFYNRRAVVRAYDGDVLVFAHKSNIKYNAIVPGSGGNGNRAHNMYHSINNGASWNIVELHLTTTNYHYCGGAQAPLDSTSKGYGRKLTVTIPATYDAIRATTIAVTVLEDVHDVNPGPDDWWFSRQAATNLRVLKKGNDVSQIYPHLYDTQDDFATPATEYDLPYTNIRQLAPFTHSDTDYFMIFGADNCDSGFTGSTAHHILVSDAEVDMEDLVAKGGDNVSTPPYSDSIPDVGGGTSYDGIQVVESL